MSASVRPWRSLWAVLAAIAATLPFVGAFSTTHVFFVRDLGLYFWPRHVWLLRSWREGDLPFWDPFAGGGQSAVADAMNHFFLLPALLARLLAPPVVGFNIWVAAPAPLLAVGAWLWLRRRFSGAAAAVGAGLVALCGPAVSAGNFPNLSWTVAFIPWILWATDRVCAAPDARPLALLALIVGAQAVAGEPVTFAGTCALVVTYAGAMYPFEGRHALVRRGGWIAGSLIAGVFLAAVQLAPLAVAVSRSVRGGNIDATFWSLHPLAVLETVVPHLFGHVYHANLETLPWVTAINMGREPLFYSLYLGIGACALALIRPADTSTQRWRRYWFVVAILSLLAALGEYTPAYPIAQSIVPVLQSFRFPVKYILFTTFAVAALAAAGADAMLRHARSGNGMARPGAALTLLAVTTLVAIVLGVGSQAGLPQVSELWRAMAVGAGIVDVSDAVTSMTGAAALWLRLAALSGVTALLLLVVLRRERASALAATVICAMSVADPLSVNADLHPTIEASRLGPPEWVAATRAHPEDRVYVGGRVGATSGRERRTTTATSGTLLDSPNEFRAPVEWTIQEGVTIYSTRFAFVPAAWEMRELISYDLPQLWPREYVSMLRHYRLASPDERLRFLGRTGHRYCYLQTPPFPGAVELGASEIARPMALYECDGDPEIAYVTPAAAVEPSVDRQLERLFEENHDPTATVLVQHEPGAPDGTPATPAATPGARIVSARNMELTLKADVPAGGGYLTLFHSYDPFWIVEVDGKRGTLLRANGLFRALHLAPGAHEVRFRYRPLPFYAGLVVSCLTLVALLVACARTAMISRRGRAERLEPS